MRRKVPDWALRGRAKSLLIYLPPEIKAALDAMATQAGLSRSAMIAGLVSSALAQGWPKWVSSRAHRGERIPDQ